MSINYGTKKIIYSKKREDAVTKDTDNHTKLFDWNKVFEWDTDKKQQTPLFILCNTGSEMKVDHFKAKKCYCADCKEVFDMDIDTNCDSYTSYKNTSEVVNVPSDFSHLVKDANPVCPSCGKTITKEHPAVFLTQSPASDTHDTNTVTHDSSWNIPPIMSGRYVFAFYDENNHATRIDDNIMLEHTRIFPSGKTFTHETEISQTMDFVTGRIVSYQTDITNKTRTPVGNAQEVVNPFLYKDNPDSFSMETRMNVADARGVFVRCTTVHLTVDYQNFKDTVFSKSFDKKTEWKANHEFSRSFAGIDPSAMKLMTEEISDLKADIACEHIKNLNIHPVYGNLHINGLNWMEHTKDSDESNTKTDREKQNVYMYLMIKYPAAAELAVEKAELRVKNFEFSEKRKANENPDYTAKTATDKARAKFFREEMLYVAEQLSACDDKILNEIRLASFSGASYVYKDNKIQKVDEYHSPESNSEKTSDLQIMKDRLSFFVYGLRDGYSVPGDIAVKLKNAKTLTPATTATKKLKNNFNTEPIATASNIYTLRKWGITNSDHVKQVLDLLNEQSPAVNPVPSRSKFSKFTSRHFTPFINAGILSPVRDKTAMSFLKLYGKTHDTSAIISQILDNRGDTFRASKWQELVEDCRLYGDVMENKAVKIIRTRDDMTESVSVQEDDDQKKTQLRNYLDNSGTDGIKNAYRDFAGIYGANTVDIINHLAREIKTDRKMDEIKRFSDINGIEEAAAVYHDFLSDCENPAECIANHKLFSDRTLVMSTRNNKPLFERDLKEIHDELSEINRKSVTENTYLSLSDDVLSMNETVPVDLSTLPDSQWDVPASTGSSTFSFHVLDNKFDFVRVATDLRNCVAGSSYFNNVERRRSIIASMRNENNQTCACIELIPTNDHDDGNKYYIKQLQGYRDSVVDKRYSTAISDWAARHDIDLSRDPDDNVKACLNGEKRYFYGGGNADYHTDEYDPVLNTSVSIRKAESLRAERIAKAVELYGGDTEHGPLLPDVPDDLKY